ncbi:hypothetical protein EVA_17265 [gut metagenome]|uniref:Uncharacterized protein n=1 Tax=gut metagenome TaxID=749906 RepID=J9FIB9_9ZZZZ
MQILYISTKTTPKRKLVSLSPGAVYFQLLTIISYVQYSIQMHAIPTAQLKGPFCAKHQAKLNLYNPLLQLKLMNTYLAKHDFHNEVHLFWNHAPAPYPNR